MRVLIACEESQAICIAFRELGFEAYSCDILPCSGGHPERHIQGDAIEEAYSGKYDMMVAHPPCTDLAVSGARHFERKRADGSQQRSIDFFMKLINAPIKHIAVENPVCIMSSIYKKPDQIIQPRQFGDEAQKTTCLRLKNLPQLKHTNVVSKGEFKTTSTGKRFSEFMRNPGGKRRSKTFPGIAKAIADQWGEFLSTNL